jgi:hypothetical protein
LCTMPQRGGQQGALERSVAQKYGTFCKTGRLQIMPGSAFF